jgi:hypothetical protein
MCMMLVQEHASRVSVVLCLGLILDISPKRVQKGCASAVSILD